MAESKEQRPPKPGFSPGGYLPRLWKAEPEPSAEIEPVPGKKKKKKGAADEPAAKSRGKKGKPPEGEDDGTKKGVLLEETPSLDTIEARRTARIIAGSVATLLVVIIGFLIFRTFSGPSGADLRMPEERVVLVDPRLLRERNETEARTMIERAREVARTGNTELALSLLTRLTTAYPETKAAAVAREAITRPKLNQPLFPDISLGAAKASGASTAKGQPARPQDVPAAEKPQAPATNASTAQASVSTSPEAPMAVTIPTPVPVQAASTPVPAATTPSRPLPAGYQARSGVGIHPSGWPLEIFGGRDGAMMVLVPGGTFIMGRDGGEPAEAPAHQVKLSTYYIDKHEVTNRQFDQFVKEAGPRVERNRALAREGGGLTLSEDNPVVMVSAREAMEYADWASKRLPTEAQWEVAARGTDHRLYPWGPLPPVWEKPREPRQIDPVMSFPADLSPFGAYDLAGNALEWTRDWFDSRYYSSIRGAIAEDPTGPVSRPSSLQMSVRGGSRQWIVSAREGIKYESRLPFLGFRCVLPVEGAEAVFQPSAPFLQDRRGPGVPVKKKVLIPF